MSNYSGDRSVLEAASWRLASELVRRHPQSLVVRRTHPGGGQYDCLTIEAVAGAGGCIQLNRHGTIQVHGGFGGRTSAWEPTEWDEYLRADPREFLHAIEAASGLAAPSSVPASTSRSLTLRVIAAIVATAFKTIDPIEVHPGFIDSSLGSGPNDEDFSAFTAIAEHLTEWDGRDWSAHPGHRFWFIHRSGTPILAFEQEQGLAWTAHAGPTWNLADLYTESRRHLLVTALKLLRRVDHV